MYIFLIKLLLNKVNNTFFIESVNNFLILQKIVFFLKIKQTPLALHDMKKITLE